MFSLIGLALFFVLKGGRVARTVSKKDPSQGSYVSYGFATGLRQGLQYGGSQDM